MRASSLTLLCGIGVLWAGCGGEEGGTTPDGALPGADASAGTDGAAADAAPASGIDGSALPGNDGGALPGNDGGALPGPDTGGMAAETGAAPDSGAGPDGAPVTGSWINMTANLAGLPSTCGAVGVVAPRADRDMVITNVAENGLWASENGATTWTRLGQGAGSAKIENRSATITFDPTTPGTWWQSGAYGPCAYKTTDNGATFTKLGDAAHCDGLSVDFTDPQRRNLIAGGHESNKLHKSTDGGMTWTDIGGQLPAGSGFSGYPLFLDSQTIMVATWFSGSAGLFRTTTGGGTWTKVHSGAVRSRPLVASDGAIYWQVENGGLVRSTDKGATWTVVVGGNVLSSTEGGIVELPDGRLLSSAPRNLKISRDRGATWQALGPQLPFVPFGISYAPHRKAIFIWHFDCMNGVYPVIGDAIMRLDFDHRTQ